MRTKSVPFENFWFGIRSRFGEFLDFRGRICWFRPVLLLSESSFVLLTPKQQDPFLSPIPVLLGFSFQEGVNSLHPVNKAAGRK